MTKLQPQLILATFLAVLLLKSACLGLERSASDYLYPLYKVKGSNPTEIKRDALWFEMTFETHFVGESIEDMKNFLDYVRWKLGTGIYHKQPESPPYRAEKYKGPRLRFVGLSNDDFSKTWKLDSPKIDLDGRSNVLVEICDSLDPIKQPRLEANPLYRTEFSLRRDLDEWLKFARVFTSLYDIPADDAIIIYENGMRFGSSKSNQPRSRLFYYMKHYALSLSQYLGSANYSMTHYETTLDQFFAKRGHETSLIDENLWRIAFKVDLKESSNSVRASTESDRSVIEKQELKELFLSSRCPLELRKSLENSVGLFTIAMGVAPAEIRKLEGLDFGFAKRIEYLRICNQLDNRDDEEES